MSLSLMSVLCQYHAVLITVALLYCLKYERVMPLALLSSPSGLLWQFWVFYASIYILGLFCSGSVKNVMSNLIGITSNL